MNLLERQIDAKDRRLRHLQTLHHITETLNHSLNVKDALEASLELLAVHSLARLNTDGIIGQFVKTP